MATPAPPLPAPPLLHDLIADLQQSTVLWQIGVIVVALGAAYAVNRVLGPRLDGAEGRWTFGARSLERALFPLVALLVTLAGQAALAAWQATHLLRVAVALLAAMAIVRLTLFLLRSAFRESKLLAAWERAIAWTVWIGVALHLTDLLAPIAAFLDSIRIPVGRHPVSVLLIAQALLSVALTVLVALWLGRLVEHRLMGAEALDINLRVILAKLGKSLLLLLGVLIALPAVGIDLTLLSVFGGALGVGLGFGLQRIASNYVSGFIMLADRSVSIGNSVSVGGRDGVVTRMTARYIVVRSLDGSEAIIPNETIITSTVINQSYSDPEVRVPLPLQVPYDCDLEAVIALLVDLAKAHPRVLAQPRPNVLVLGLGDGGINLELGVWIADPDAGRNNLRSDLYRGILAAFRERGIELPPAQREPRPIGNTPAAAT